ncbi:MAG: matrixin family metalloprotease [Myxococcales bacterium]|nr:matrixin family metalloprotease [Myxococcales bacterium]
MRRLAGVAAALCLALSAAPAFAWTALDSCRPTWSSLPSGYYVNSAGYSGIPLATVRQIFVNSFAEWARPCCSDWSAVDLGTTSGVGEDNTNSQNIMSFRETSWPRELGDATSTLAVTLTTWSYDRSGNCTNLTADMIFNAANHTFATSHSSTRVDLQSVATHEAGHWLGLGHSTVATATMKPYYTDEGDRSLHSDDESGVCTLYPGDCGCTTSADCDPGQVCTSGECVQPPCTSSGDCAAGLECDTASGDCVVPPCRSDADCIGAQICVSGVCILDADCPTCLPCDTADDCGGGEWQCASDGTTGFCTRICEAASDCPGNSECFAIEGETFAVCLNDDAIEAGTCYDGFVCTAGVCDGIACPSGQTCDPETGRCVTAGGADGCIVCDPCTAPAQCPGGDCFDFGDGGLCAIECARDSDCPPNTACLTFGDGGGDSISLCLNADYDTAGACPRGFECSESTDPCDGVTCRAGTACDPATGDCIPTGADVGTDSGGADAGSDAETVEDATGTDAGGRDTGVRDTASSDGGSTASGCGICTPCDDTACPGSTECVVVGAAGAMCTIDCASSSDVCPGGTACFEVSIGAATRSLCLNEDAAAAGICPAPVVCTATGGGETPVPFGFGTTKSGCASASGSTGAPGAIVAGLVLTRRRRRGSN